MLWLWLLLFIVGLALLFVHIIGIRNENYWKKRGVVFSTDNKVMGPLMRFVTKDQAMFQVYQDLYKKYPEAPAIGVGGFMTPTIFVTHPANVQHVLQGDFGSFNHRGFKAVEEDKLADNIMFQNGERWKVLRQNMTPIFTSAKLRNMYYIIDKSAQDFVDYLHENPKTLNEDLCDTLSSFCSAAIGGAVFGIGTESIFDSPFLDMARKSLQTSFLANVKFVLPSLLPSITKFFGIKVFAEHEKFFIGAIRKVLEQRKANNVKMHDFADLCLNIEEKGTMIDRNTNYEVEPSVELFAAQAFFFFIAGVEPCALAAHATLLELGRNPEYLKMVHEEIDSTFEKHSQLTLDIVNGLEVLDKVYNESIRIHPPVGTLTRRCTKTTVLPVGNIKIDAGTHITLPIYNLQVDERYYPNAHEFDPERWAPGGGVNKDLFMPFGKGNRVCIGARYATLQVKAGLVHLLRHFTVKTDVTPGPPKYKKHPLAVRDMNLKVKLLPRDISVK